MIFSHFALGRMGSRITLLLVGLALLGTAPIAGGANTQSPAVPPDLTAIAVSVREVDLAWSTAADGVYSYTIRRNDLLLATLYGAVQSYIDTSVRPTSTYTYTIVALYASWAESPPSAPAVVRTPALPDTPDTSPASPPTDLNAVLRDEAVFLDWQDAIDDTDISAYQVRRNGLLLATVNSGTLSYSDTTVLSATTYLYSVEALDVMGQHSQPSNLVTITTPANP
jgi:fibronectin type 3 domain-containing protein